MAKNSKKILALIVSFCMLISLVSVCGITSFAETPVEPIFNAETCNEIALKNSSQAAYNGEKLTYSVGFGGSDIYSGALPSGSIDFYTSAVIKTDGFSSVDFTYRTVSNAYFHIEKTKYSSPGTGLADQTVRHNNIVDGIRVTMHVTQSHLQVWVEGELLVDGDITDTNTLASTNTRFGFSWVQTNAFDVEISDFKVWTVKPAAEPIYDEATCHSFTVKHEDGTVYESEKVYNESMSDVLYTPLSGRDAEFYTSMIVKTDGYSYVRLTYRETGNGYFQIAKTNYSSPGTGLGEQTVRHNNIVNGIRVTMHVTKSHLQVWVEGELLVDDDITDSTTLSSSATRFGFSWIQASMTTTISDLKIWVKSDEADFTDGDVLANTDSTVIADGTNGLKEILFDTSTMGSARIDYYMSMNVVSNADAYIRIANGDMGFLYLAAGGYTVKPTDNTYTALANGLKNAKCGVDVTIHFTPTNLTVWLNGVKVADGATTKLDGYTANNYSCPGIRAAAGNTVTVSNLKIWNTTDAIGEVFDKGKDSNYKSLLGTSAEIEEGSFNGESNTWFTRNLSTDKDYYASFTLKNTTSGTSVSFSYRMAQYIQFQYGGYVVMDNNVKAQEDWQHKFALDKGIKVKVHSTETHTTIWVDGAVLFDKDITPSENSYGASPRITYISKGTAELSDIKVWTENTLADIDEDDEITGSDLALLKKYLLGSESIQPEDGDLNYDDSTDLLDIICFKKYFAGIAVIG